MIGFGLLPGPGVASGVRSGSRVRWYVTQYGPSEMSFRLTENAGVPAACLRERDHVGPGKLVLGCDRDARDRNGEEQTDGDAERGA